MRGAKTFAELHLLEKQLPKIRRLVLELMKKNQLLSILDSIELIHEDEYEYFDTDIKKNKAIYKLSYDFYKDVEKLFKMNVVVKDVDSGFIDIFAKAGDKQYFFCWHVHEEKLKHWHETFEDCQDRKSLSIKVNK